MAVLNTLAYYDAATITFVKTFYGTTAIWAIILKNLIVVIYANIGVSSCDSDWRL